MNAYGDYQGTGRCRHCGKSVTDWTAHPHKDCPGALHALGYPLPPTRLKERETGRPPLLIGLLTHIPWWYWTNPGLLAEQLRRHADRLDRIAHDTMMKDAA